MTKTTSTQKEKDARELIKQARTITLEETLDGDTHKTIYQEEYKGITAKDLLEVLTAEDPYETNAWEENIMPALMEACGHSHTYTDIEDWTPEGPYEMSSAIDEDENDYQEICYMGLANFDSNDLQEALIKACQYIDELDNGTEHLTANARNAIVEATIAHIELEIRNQVDNLRAKAEELMKEAEEFKKECAGLAPEILWVGGTIGDEDEIAQEHTDLPKTAEDLTNDLEMWEGTMNALETETTKMVGIATHKIAYGYLHTAKKRVLDKISTAREYLEQALKDHQTALELLDWARENDDNYINK